MRNMMLRFDHKLMRIIVFAIILFQSGIQKVHCQETILDSVFSFNAGRVKTIVALDLISKQTGFRFTYDSRLIDTERITDMVFESVTLKNILRNITENDSIDISIIDKFIVFSRKLPPSYISGIVTDEESGEPLLFATIALRNSGRGAVTNNDGQFRLNISREMLNDTIYVSMLGYKTAKIPIIGIINNNIQIAMKRDFIAIPAIIIKSQTPQEIISKAVKAIPENYSKTPVYLAGFYREGALKRKKLQNYSEAVLMIFKDSYSNSLPNDQIKVLKSRKLENADTLTIRLKAGLKTSIELDGVQNLFDFLGSESMPDYIYMVTDKVTYEDEAAYVIEFGPRRPVEMPLCNGTLYINTADFAILRAEYELNEAYLLRMKDLFIASSIRGFTTWPISVKYTISYRKYNDVYYLNHVRSDLNFLSRKNRSLFNTPFTVFFELAITNIETNNVVRFDRGEQAPVNSVFSRTITNYDAEFWGNQDFLRPEDNLLKELKNMKVNIEEFSQLED